MVFVQQPPSAGEKSLLDLLYFFIARRENLQKDPTLNTYSSQLL